MRLERFRQRAARPHALVNVVQNAFEMRVGDTAAQDVQRLHQRHPGLEQGGQFLVEDEEFAGGNPGARGELETAEHGAAGALDRENVEAFFFELLPEPGLRLSGIDALDNLSTGCPQPAAELHPITLRPAARRRKLLSVLTLSAHGNPRIIYQQTSARRHEGCEGYRGSAAPRLEADTGLLIRQGRLDGGLESCEAYRVPGAARDRMRLT